MPVPDPTYIHIDSFRFEKNPAVSADSLTDINTVWAYYNGNLIGEFDLPATFPVLATGTGQVMLTPGIPNTGLNNEEANYPFYTNDTFTINAMPGKLITHSAVTSYYSATKVSPIADFTAVPGFSLVGGAGGLTIINADSLKYHHGPTAGIFLNSPGDSTVIVTNNPFTINTSYSFIEFDYNCTMPFSVSLQPVFGSSPAGSVTFLAGVSPNRGWHKFYIYVSEYAMATKGDSYNLWIQANQPPDQQYGIVLLANINLLSIGY